MVTYTINKVHIIEKKCDEAQANPKYSKSKLYVYRKENITIIYFYFVMSELWVPSNP
jgi:hypothetical protein